MKYGRTRSRRRRAVFLVTAWLSLPSLLLAQEARPWWTGIEDVPPGVTVIEVDSSYSISASSAAELRRQMDRRGVLADGHRWDGYHFYRWQTHYRRDESWNGCAVDRFTILIRSVIVTPSWEEAKEFPRLGRAWRLFVAALDRHEEGHRSILERAAKEYDRRASRLTAESCPELRARLERLNDWFGDRMAARQAAYDRRTENGRRQSAVWPPER